MYGEENLAFLSEWSKKHGALDTYISEGTYGSLYVPGGHMDAHQLAAQFADLRRVSALDAHTRVFITHINQVQHYSHAEYQNALALTGGANVTVAYDGMRI